MQNRNIFISHSSKNKTLADELVDLLQTGLNISSNDIFCSSLEGLGIPKGENFLSYIKAKLQNPDIIILLLTQNYLESRFCLCEMGATWAMSHEFIPLIVPPVTPFDINGILGNIQAADISKPIDLTEFAIRLEESLKLPRIDQPRWEAKRDIFIQKLTKILNELPLPTSVEMEKYELLERKYQETINFVDDLSGENKDLKQFIEDLKKCKDAEAVQEIEKKFLPELEKLDHLIDKFRLSLNLLPIPVPLVVYKEMSGYGVTFDPLENDFEYKKAIEAVENRFLDSLGDTFSLNTSDRKVSRAIECYTELDNFIENEASSSLCEHFENENDYEFSLRNKRFWDDYLL